MSAYTINTTFEGNLVDDVILRETNSGRPVANFRVAVTSRTALPNGQFRETTQFQNVVAWNGMAVNAAASLAKGNRVIVSGDLRDRQYDDKDGVTRYVKEVHANMIGVSLRFHVTAGIEKASEALAQESAEAPLEEYSA